MTGSFEVSAIKDVRAACPVCDPVASIYGPVPDGSSLPSCPAFRVRGQRPPAGAAPAERADLWRSDAGGRAPGLRPCPGTGQRTPWHGLGSAAHPCCTRSTRAEASAWEQRSPRAGRPSRRGRALGHPRASLSPFLLGPSKPRGTFPFSHHTHCSWGFLVFGKNM